MDSKYLHVEYLNFHLDKIKEGFSPLEIAAIIATQALSIYKTILDDESYQDMVDLISESRDSITPLVDIDIYGTTLQ